MRQRGRDRLLARPGYVGARTHLDEARLLALDPAADVAGIRAALGAGVPPVVGPPAGAVLLAGGYLADPLDRPITLGA